MTNAERHDLETVAKLLGISTNQLDALLESASNKLQRALSGRNQQALGNDLVGKSVCITGALLCTIAGDRIDRSTAYTLSEQAGLIPMQSVTKNLDLLVTADASTTDGQTLTGEGCWVFKKDGKTLEIVGSVKRDGKDLPKLRDVFTRVAK